MIHVAGEETLHHRRRFLPDDGEPLLGSTIDDVSVYTKLFALLEKAIKDNADLLGDIRIVNVGGGLGINYHHEESQVSTWTQ